MPAPDQRKALDKMARSFRRLTGNPRTATTRAPDEDANEQVPETPNEERRPATP